MEHYYLLVVYFMVDRSSSVSHLLPTHMFTLNWS